MGMPVGELLARTSARELSEWMAFEREYGLLGPERGDWQAANVAYVVAAGLGGKKARKFKLTNFVLSWSQRRKQTPTEQLAALQALARAQDARLKR